MKRSYFLLALGLLGYGLKRYNGYDLDSYFQLAEAAHSGVSLYGEKNLSLYPPPGAYLLELLYLLPQKQTHFLWYLLTLVIFFRMSNISFSFFDFQKELSWKQGIFFWLSWIAMLQGLGAQLEGGNINILLMYLILEGTNLLARSDTTMTKIALGLFFVWLPTLFKPYLGLISAGLNLFYLKRGGWKSLIGPMVLAFLVAVIPILGKGWPTVFSDYRHWLSGDLDYIDCAFTLKCNAVNYGFPSYFYQIHHWALGKIFVLIFTVSLMALIYSSIEKNIIRLVAALSLITFTISPASFPYGLMLLWLTVNWACYLIVFGRGTGRPMAQTCAWIFVGAMIFLNPTYLGRPFFNEVIVYYRVTTFFILLGLGTLSMRNPHFIIAPKPLA